jgi:hypothetical protein
MRRLPVRRISILREVILQTGNADQEEYKTLAGLTPLVGQHLESLPVSIPSSALLPPEMMFLEIFLKYVPTAADTA